MNRRLFLAAAAAMATGKSFAQQNRASWPVRPVRFIVPYAAGGPTDVARESSPKRSPNICLNTS